MLLLCRYSDSCNQVVAEYLIGQLMEEFNGQDKEVKSMLFINFVCITLSVRELPM